MKVTAATITSLEDGQGKGASRKYNKNNGTK